METANVTYLSFDDIWHRLCFDPGIVHWRASPAEPEPWTVGEEAWSYPHVDVGLVARLIGVRLKSYKTLVAECGASVVFEFENSCQVHIKNVGDRTSYEVM